MYPSSKEATNMPREKEPLIKPAIINAAQRGDSGAFVQIYETYHPLILRFLTRRFRDPQLAEDITQETFLKALAAISGTSEDLKIGAWLTRIAYTTTLNVLKKEARVIVTDPKSAELDKAVNNSSENEALNRIAIKDTYDLFDPSNPDQVNFRNSLFLSALGFKHGEIGLLTGEDNETVIPQTVATRISRARKHIKKSAA